MDIENNTFKNLKSNDPELVLQSIEEIREKGNNIHFSALLDLLHETQNKQIRKKILTLFGELKSSDTVPLLINAIQDEQYKRELKDLVACCWQNGLNYSSFLPVFVDLVIEEDFPVGFEALTVIENMFGKIDQHIIDQQLAKLKNVTVTSNEQKNYLLDSLPSVIQNIPENQQDSPDILNPDE